MMETCRPQPGSIFPLSTAREGKAYYLGMRSWGMLLGLLSSCIYGQGNFASIEGRIVDSSQHPISGARIEIRAKATGAVRSTLTNEVGLFEVPSLPPAEYLVVAAAE